MAKRRSRIGSGIDRLAKWMLKYRIFAIPAKIISNSRLAWSIVSRIDRVREIYLSKEILYLIINNFQKNIFNSYLLSIIDQINPKIIFTFIDNSYRFSEFSKLRANKYRFIALQNGARYEHKIIKNLQKKKIKTPIKKFNIPNFLCFGDHEIRDYNKTKQNVKNFYKVGSLKLANFLFKKKQNKKKLG